MGFSGHELKVVPTQFLSDMNRSGLALVALIVSVLFVYFSFTKQLPAQDQLSRSQIMSLAFGTLQSSTRSTQTRNLGHAFVIPWDALPERFEKSAPQAVWEPLIRPIDRRRNVLIHDAIKLSPFEIDKLDGALNNTVDVWFWEGKIAVVEITGKKIISYELAAVGINNERDVMLLIGGLALLLSLSLVFYPRLKLS